MLDVFLSASAGGCYKCSTFKSSANECVVDWWKLKLETYDVYLSSFPYHFTLIEYISSGFNCTVLQSHVLLLHYYLFSFDRHLTNLKAVCRFSGLFMQVSEKLNLKKKKETWIRCSLYFYLMLLFGLSTIRPPLPTCLESCPPMATKDHQMPRKNSIWIVKEAQVFPKFLHIKKLSQRSRK